MLIIPKFRLLMLSLSLSACSAIKSPEILPALPYSPVCHTQLAAMQAVKVAPLQPMAGFWRNQYCIAELACQNRQAFKQSLWLDQVLQAFIQAYTQQTQHWPQIVQHCQQRSIFNPLRDWLCQRDMAQYHIYTDLSATLQQADCGDAEDWQRLQGYIHTCIQQADYPPMLTRYIQNRVVHYRTQVRNQCLSKRR